jgi:hypothetical protein
MNEQEKIDPARHRQRLLFAMSVVAALLIVVAAVLMASSRWRDSTIRIGASTERMVKPARPTTQAVAPDGVLPGNGVHGWTVQAGDVRMVVERDRDLVRISRFYYTGAGGISDEDVSLLALRVRILYEPEVAMQLNVEPEQMAQLRGFPSSPQPQVDAADRARLIDSFRTWTQAQSAHAKTEASSAMVASVADAGAKARPDLERATIERSKAVSKILTSAQLARVNDFTR